MAATGISLAVPIFTPTPSAHFGPNSFGEYHNQPTRNDTTAPTMTASQLTPVVNSAIFFLRLGFQRHDGAIVVQRHRRFAR